MKNTEHVLSSTNMDPNEQAVAGAEVAILAISPNTARRIDFISNERLRVIQPLAVESRKNGFIDLTNDRFNDLLKRLDALLRWLDLDLQMTPEIRQKTKIDAGLELIFRKDDIKFPKGCKERAKALYDKWDEENWGKNEVPEDEDVDEESKDEAKEESDVKRRRLSKVKKEPVTEDAAELAILRFPRPDHPIFGLDGIMHGVALKTGGKRKNNYVLDERYPKRDAKVYGHNGLKLGTWFPYQIIALFQGAHGSAMAGIAGDQQLGAYSIVVAGKYDDLDKDGGEYLYYSGSNSHDNEDPKRPAESAAGTKALHASLGSEQPVRVLRAASGKGRWAPSEGLRYDGLYHIVSVRQPLNGKGGKYEQFKLERLDGQEPIARNRPSAREVGDYGRIKDGFR